MSTTTTNTQLTAICDELVLFKSTDSMLELLNLDESRFFEVSAILHEFEKEWEKAECAPEGPTKEQDAELDRIVLEYAQELLNLN